MIRRHLPLLMHTYPSVTPWNVYDIEWDLLVDLIENAKAVNQTVE